MTTHSELLATLENVGDEPSFVAFVNALGRDRLDEAQKERNNPSAAWGAGANGWEHSSIDSYLFASVAWAEVSLRLPDYTVPENPWRRCADILYFGKLYQ